MSGSSSSNRTDSRTTYKTDTQNLNLQGLSGSGTTVAGTKNNVTITDGGAIKANADIAKTSVQAASNITIKSLDLTRFTVGEALATSERATRNAMQYVAQTAQPGTTQQKNLTQSAVIAAAIIGGVALVMRG